MYKLGINVKNKNTFLKVYAGFSIVAIFLFTAFASLVYINSSQPIAKFATGNCPVSKIRYSVMRKEFDKFSEGYEQSKVYWEKEALNKEENRARGIAEGCSGGEIHELYYW